MKSLKAQIALAIVFLILGFAITLQLRSVQINKSTAQPLRSEELLMELNREKTKVNDLQTQVASLKSDLAKYEQEASETSVYNKVLAEQSQKYQMLAGFTALSGPGVTITLDDSKTKNQNLVAEQLIVHESDLLRFVNELYAAGAEAVAINGERLISTSAIRCVGPTITINNSRQAPPFVMTAIGDADALYAGLSMADGIVDLYQNVYMLDVKLEKADEVTVPAYHGALQFTYARPTEEIQ